MTLAGLYTILPFDVMTVGIVVVMLMIGFYRHHALTLALTLLAIAVAFYWLFPTGTMMPRQVTPLFIIDAYAWYYVGMLLVTAAGVALLAYAYFSEYGGGLREEFYLLLLTGTLGGMVLVASSHFASLFLGLELLSVSLFGMVGYAIKRDGPLEAALKYLILTGLSSALLLFGLALIYVTLGTMQFDIMFRALATTDALSDPYMLIGLALIVVGLGFKLSLVPFHMWTPDVYQGAPAPVTAFIATASKAAVFALLLRYWVEIDAYSFSPIYLVLTIIAMASMLVGNLLAVLQHSVKRILAYSSIAHLGYLLVAFLATDGQAVQAVNYYLAAYVLTSLGAFGVVSVLSSSDRDEADDLNDYRGLFWRRPWTAGIFTLMLLSLAGIPFTAGFIAKFYALVGGVSVEGWWLVFTLVAGSAIGLFYYLRIVVALYAAPADENAVTVRPQAGAALAGALALAAFAVAVIWIGIYPDPLIYFIQHATTLT
ncbi:MAG TPA: NADH-quinone oxidoreductase subunit N [Gammaproteobacteria bacterium]|nr:NADH-quinone oxidoreductase subunit N [Gammaproteobacteria bacterium]